MTVDRALEIIDAYGADPRRWPSDERADVAARAAEPRVAAALEAAVILDRAVRAWADEPVAPGSAVDAAAAVLAARPARGTAWRWAGGGIAATLLAGMLLLQPTAAPVTPSSVLVVASVSDEAAFTLLFTPTPDEETLI